MTELNIYPLQVWFQTSPGLKTPDYIDTDFFWTKPGFYKDFINPKELPD